MILGSTFKRSYKDACERLNMKTLSERRKDLSAKFASKASNHPIHSSWFSKNPESNTRTKKLTYKPVCTRTDIFRKSAIPFLKTLINENQ